MRNDCSLRNSRFSLPGLFIIAVLFILLPGMTAEADVVRNYKASELPDGEWFFQYDDVDTTTNITLDKDCTIESIEQRFADAYTYGKLNIIGNGHKLIIGSGGIYASTSSISIQDAIVEIDTTYPYEGSYCDGIHSSEGIQIVRSNLDIITSSSFHPMWSSDPEYIECAKVSGSETGNNLSVRATHVIGSVNVTVTEPKAGEKAVFKGSVNDKNIQLTAGTLDDEKIRWYEGTKEYKETDNLTFEAGHTYKCVVHLSAKRGKVTSATNVKINGHAAIFAEDQVDYGSYTWHAWFTYEFEIPKAVPAPVADPAPAATPPSGETGVLTVTAGNGIYTIQGQQAILTGPVSKNIKSIVIPASVKKSGKKYPVTKIASKSLSGLKKLNSVTIGKNVKFIGAKTFWKCGRLKKLTIKTKKLTKKTIGASAFKGINKKATIKCPKGKKNAYKKIFLKKGMKKTMKFK
ncbi:leucine-rich repeat protein [Porcincola intestinalis]|nr:leucine-rich repeat protein [Porcincola intestinalis]